jgi:hypothetical protein
MFGVLGPFTSRVYCYWSLLNTKCNALGYWRRRSVCYSGLFTTSLVATTISFYNVLGPCDVASRSGPGSSALILESPVILSSLICVLSSLYLSLFSISLSSISVLSLYVCVRLSAASEIGCLHLRNKTPCRRVSFPVLASLRFPTIWLLRNS